MSAILSELYEYDVKCKEIVEIVPEKRLSNDSVNYNFKPKECVK